MAGSHRSVQSAVDAAASTTKAPDRKAAGTRWRAARSIQLDRNARCPGPSHGSMLSNRKPMPGTGTIRCREREPPIRTPWPHGGGKARPQSTVEEAHETGCIRPVSGSRNPPMGRRDTRRPPIKRKAAFALVPMTPLDLLKCRLREHERPDDAQPVHPASHHCIQLTRTARAIRDIRLNLRTYQATGIRALSDDTPVPPYHCTVPSFPTPSRRR
jgi:hypothetical protein